MRLLKLSPCGELSLTKPFADEDVPPYAILSHRWGEDEEEVTFNDLENGSGKSRAGYAKLQFCGKQAHRDDLQYFWVDTCCIDKANHTELSKAITSMFRWYRDAETCYVYLSDVSVPQRKRKRNNRTLRTWESAFRTSKWFSRGWTLQELLAPKSVEFYSREEEYLGNKKTLMDIIHEITDIPLGAICGDPLSDFSVDERLRWAAKRDTKVKEDKAYCLLGIFDIFMPLIYGEGENATNRLKEEIYKRSKSRLEESTMKSLEDLKITDPEEDMKRIELSKDPLLKDCYQWILQNPHFQSWRGTDTVPLLWINGDPGKGKTMLMMALVRELLNSERKVSNAVTFFFCQSTDIRLNRPTSILRGLIWKLANSHPRLAKHISDKYQSEKQLIDNPNAVVSLFLILSAMLDDCPRAFLLIDALDECSSGVERDQLLGLIKEHAKSSSKAKWLLSSRNYPEIKLSLQSESQMLSLELNEEHISKAVCAFIKQKTSELGVKMNYDQVLKEKVEMTLVDKANSTFLWVALACKRLRNVRPGKTLSTLESLPPGLKDLYTRMIEHVLQVEDEEDKDICLRILRSASLAFRPLSIGELITTADLPSQLLENNDLYLLLDHCGSFIIIRHDVLYFVHQSAKDYLVGEGALKLFPAGFQRDHSLIMSRSLSVMSQSLKRDMCNLRHPGFPRSKAEIHTSLKAISYACSFWVDHLNSSLGEDFSDSLWYKEYLPDGGRIHVFLLKHLLHWFEALSLIGEVNRGILGLQSFERIFERLATQQFEISLLKGFVHDAVRVLRQFRPAVEEAPLQVYCAILIFSPESSFIRQNFKQETPRWISPLPRVQTEWSPCLQTLEGHTRSVRSVVFSPNGQQLASCSGDGTVRLWDAASGACLQALEGHTRSVGSVVFSPNGQQLASCSDDRTVRLWDAASGACLQALEGYTSTIVFSQRGSNLVTDFGILSVGQPNWDTTPKQVGLSIGSEKWITWNSDNILWLPLEYRPLKSTAEERRIGVGCTSGLIYILNFHPDSFPD